MALIVQKYGGTSVGSIDRIKHVAKHISSTVQAGNQVVAVISAMGDQTDELLAMARQISSSPPRRELDMLLTSGERIAMALVSIALNEEGTSAVSLTGSQSGIITDSIHGNARISKITGYRIQENLDLGSVVIVAGFQGVSSESKEITTLGRGGTDLSAIALAGYLKADKCQLYKDVDGVYSVDPRMVKNAIKRNSITWDDMTLMSWSGASVLHPRGAHLAAKFKLPVEIRSSFHLERSGTIVAGNSNMEKYSIQGITKKNQMAICRLKVKNESSQAISFVRQWLWDHGESSQIQNQWQEDGETIYTLSLPESLVPDISNLLKKQNITHLSHIVPTCTLITLIGSGFWQSPELTLAIRTVVPSPLFEDVKNNSITIAVPPIDAENIITGLHKKLFED